MVQTIALLSGGFSCEREISLMSGKAVKKALDSLFYKVVEIDVDSDIVSNIKKTGPDLAFIALHGPYGEDGCIQGLLEILGIRYTHSRVMASSIAMNKVMSKHIFQSLNIDTPQGYVINVESLLKNNIKINYPYVLKPINEGSSIGVQVISSKEDYSKYKGMFDVISDSEKARISFLYKKEGSSWINKNYIKNHSLIVEEYIPGIELHTAVLLDEAIGTMEIRPKNKFYDYEAKYTDEFTEYVFPPVIPDCVYKMTLEYALKVHRFLGCRTISRSDFRYNPENNTLKMLEINTHPGLTELSLVPKIVKSTKEIGFNELIQIIIKDAA